MQATQRLHNTRARLHRVKMTLILQIWQHSTKKSSMPSLWSATKQPLLDEGKIHLTSVSSLPVSVSCLEPSSTYTSTRSLEPCFLASLLEEYSFKDAKSFRDTLIQLPYCPHIDNKNQQRDKKPHPSRKESLVITLRSSQVLSTVYFESCSSCTLSTLYFSQDRASVSILSAKEQWKRASGWYPPRRAS